jgi:hypothetical protein
MGPASTTERPAPVLYRVLAANPRRTTAPPPRRDARRRARNYRITSQGSACARVPETPARDEDQASAGARSTPFSLMHRWQSSSAAVTAPFHAYGHCHRLHLQPDKRLDRRLVFPLIELPA